MRLKLSSSDVSSISVSQVTITSCSSVYCSRHFLGRNCIWYVPSCLQTSFMLQFILLSVAIVAQIQPIINCISVSIPYSHKMLIFSTLPQLKFFNQQNQLHVLTADVMTVSRSRQMCRVTVPLLSPRLVFVESIRFATSRSLHRAKPETTVFNRL